MGIKKFLKSQHGIAAVEFALILPVLLVMLVGSVTAFDVYRADRSVSLAANTVVDLAARQDQMNDIVRDSLFASAQALLGRYGNDESYGISITSISHDVMGDLVVDWSEANANGQALMTDDIPSLDLPSFPVGDSTLLVVLNNDYQSTFINEITFSRNALRRPRFVAKVTYN